MHIRLKRRRHAFNFLRVKNAQSDFQGGQGKATPQEVLILHEIVVYSCHKFFRFHFWYKERLDCAQAGWFIELEELNNQNGKAAPLLVGNLRTLGAA
jgi:hypothetical protein